METKEKYCPFCEKDVAAVEEWLCPECDGAVVESGTCRACGQKTFVGEDGYCGCPDS